MIEGAQRGALVGLALLGCAPQNALPLPEVQDGRSMILISGEGPTATAFAFDLSDRSNALSIVVPEGQSQALTALAYQVPLSDFELEPGRIDTVNDGTGTPFPRPFESFVARLRAGEAAPDWSPGEPQDYAAIEIQLPLHTPCARFDIEHIPVDSENDTIFAFAIDPDRALVSGGGAIFLADERESRRLETDPPGLRLTAGFVDESQQIWIGTRGSIVRVTSIDDQTLRWSHAVSIRNEIDQVVAVQGGPIQGAMELFAITQSGRVYRWITTSSTAEQVLDLTEIGETSNAELAWIGPGEVFVVSSLAPKLIHIVGDQVEEITPLPLMSGGPGCLAQRESGELLVGGLFGEVGAYRDGTWIDRSPRAALRIRAMQPNTDGYFWVGSSGLFGEVLDDFGACPTRADLAITHHHVFPIGDRMMAVPNVLGYGLALIRSTEP